MVVGSRFAFAFVCCRLFPIPPTFLRFTRFTIFCWTDYTLPHLHRYHLICGYVGLPFYSSWFWFCYIVLPHHSVTAVTRSTTYTTTTFATIPFPLPLPVRPFTLFVLHLPALPVRSRSLVGPGRFTICCSRPTTYRWLPHARSGCCPVHRTRACRFLFIWCRTFARCGRYHHHAFPSFRPTTAVALPHTVRLVVIYVHYAGVPRAYARLPRCISYRGYVPRLRIPQNFLFLTLRCCTFSRLHPVWFAAFNDARAIPTGALRIFALPDCYVCSIFAPTRAVPTVLPCLPTALLVVCAQRPTVCTLRYAVTCYAF